MPVAAGLYYFAHQADNLMCPPVILIHGAGGSYLSWPPQVRRMHDQRIFAVDLPGHGKSTGIGHQTIGDYVEEIAGFLNALRLNAAVWIGHSMGSAVALEAALRFPERVLGLVLLGSGARLRVAPSILQSASSPSTFQDALRVINDFSYAPQTGERLRELGVRQLSNARPAVLYGDFVACDAFNITDQLSRIVAPTLILCGAEDRMMPLKNSEFLREHMTNAHLEVLPGAGHMAMAEQPDRVAGLLTDFLKEIPYKPGQ